MSNEKEGRLKEERDEAEARVKFIASYEKEREIHLTAERQSIADVLERVIVALDGAAWDLNTKAWDTLLTDARSLLQQLRQGCQAQAESEC